MLMTTLIVRDVDDVRKAMNIIERFSKVFGVKVNIQKNGFYEYWECWRESATVLFF